MTCTCTLNLIGLLIIGLLMDLSGVILLFRYGVPCRVRTDGDVPRAGQQRDPKAVKAEGRYEVLGNLGLALIALGTVVQVIAFV